MRTSDSPRLLDGRAASRRRVMGPARRHRAGLPCEVPLAAHHYAGHVVAWCLILALLAALWPWPAVAQGGTTYEVQPGDTLSTIAATYGTTVDAIMEANGLASPDTVWVGQSLTIPVQASAPSAGSGPATNTYTVRLGDTLASIAQTLGVSGDALAEANGLTDPDLLWVGQRLLVPGTSLGGSAVAPPPERTVRGGYYTVQPGDTLNSIAQSLGVTTLDLMKANDLSDADLLLVGQRLAIPGSPTPLSATTTPPARPTGTTSAPASSPVPATAPVPSVTLPAPSATPRPSNTPARPAFYVVQPGDTLNLIAARLGVTALALMEANQLDNADLLSVGQKLAVPGAGPTATPTSSATPSPRPGTATSPPSGSAILTVAPTPTPSPAPQPTPVRYTVQRGDTIGAIARKFNSTAAEIARANRLTSPDLVSVGMTLIIPAPPWTAPNITRPSRFVVSISQQRCWLYQGNDVVANWPCSTGKPGTDTHPGSYKIQSRMEKAYGSTWDIWMPYWLGIYWAGASENGIHGIPYNADNGWTLWEGLVGTPVTYGCVLLDQVHAKELFDLAYIGMPVIIQR